MMSVERVINLLSILKLSVYRGKDPKQLRKVLRRSEAYNYLINISIFNSMLKSQLATIEECNLQDEWEIRNFKAQDSSLIE